MKEKADQVFSDYIRTRDNWQCQPCKLEGKNKLFKPPQRVLKISSGYHDRHKSSFDLHTMHCFGRGNKITRFDEKNSLAGCGKHHRYLDLNRYEKEALFESVLGSLEFGKLEIRHHQTTRVDYRAKIDYYRAMLELTIIERNVK